MAPKPITKNTLFYGDNLPILRDYIADESVDLTYLDPPFNSNRSYNVLFKDESGHEAESQIEAFDDTWHWNAHTEAVYDELVTTTGGEVGLLVGALRQAIGSNQMMAYLVMMAARLVELHRVLKPMGSLYLHCDPTASHYLKILLDAIFGANNFRNEIVWKRASSHNDPKGYGNIHDTILFYSKSTDYVWNPQYTPYTQDYLDAEWRKLPSGRMYKCENMLDPQGKMKEYEFMGTLARWRTNHEGMLALWNLPQTEVPASHGRIKLGRDGQPTKRCRIIFIDELKGTPLQTWWDDIMSLRGGAAERLGYPTQKPIALLERIIRVSCPADGVVLDAFCGCGTTIAAAQKLNRRWIGIDITQLAIALQKYRLADSFPDAKFDVIGEPTDVQGARQLAQDDRYQFQWWALSLIKARPLGGQGTSKTGKKGSDKGVDGVITFIEDAKGKPGQILVQVKSGHVKSGDIRDLAGTVEREKSAMGLFITLEEPSRDMDTEAATAGIYHSTNWGTFPKIQILTVEQLLHGQTFKTPPPFGTFKQAQRSDDESGKQGKLQL